MTFPNLQIALFATAVAVKQHRFINMDQDPISKIDIPEDGGECDDLDPNFDSLSSTEQKKHLKDQGYERIGIAFGQDSDGIKSLNEKVMGMRHKVIYIKDESNFKDELYFAYYTKKDKG